MKYSIAAYDDSFRQAWDDFVGLSRNGTIFHKRKFLSYHPPGRFKDNSLIINKGGKAIALFPAADIEKDGMRTLFSHPGASYGGLVVPFDFGIRDAFGSVEKIVDYAASGGFHAVEIRHSERSMHKAPAEEIDFALSHYGFGYSKRELSSAISLRLLDDAVTFDIFDYSAVKSVKKALKSGLEFRFTSARKDFARFYSLLQQNLKERHKARPTHTREELNRLLGLFPDDILLCGAYLNGVPIGYLLVFVCNSKAVHIFYTAQDFKYSTECRPINFLYYKLIEWARERGFDYINIGISTEDGGRTINWSLFNFKETLGARGLRRDTYRLDLRA